MLGPVCTFLDSLSAQQRGQASYPFEAPARTDWHYFPRERPGLPLGAMTGEQQGLAWAALHASLSEAGYTKARGVVRLERILRDIGEDPEEIDPLGYDLAVFGNPDEARPWAWRFEGHHLSLTFAHLPARPPAVTPAFLGAHPAEVPHGHTDAGLRVLAREQDLAFALVQGLDDGLRQQALIAADSLGDIVTGPGREQWLQAPAGLPLHAMTEPQQDAAMRLAQEYLGNMPDDVAERQMRRLREAGPGNVHFAWAGSLAPGRPHYYRLHGPTLIIEYDNTQNDANHVHSVWHDPTEEFGIDLLRAHHERDHR